MIMKLPQIAALAATMSLAGSQAFAAAGDYNFRARKCGDEER